jgi:methylphosphotriester-DNA--protein-cysteine methyltransferase
MRVSPPGANAEAQALARRIADFIESQSPARPGVESIARAVGAHPRTMARAFAAIHGITIREYLDRRHFEVATALISEMKVEAVASMMGISKKAIYRLVRARAECTPAALRRRTVRVAPAPSR